jgi:hypothetical protein
MVGQAWSIDPSTAPQTSNGFDITLTGARAVTLSMRRMRIQAWRAIDGKVSADSDLVLTLLGRWPATETAEVDGAAVALQRTAGAVVLSIPAGQHTIRLVP